MKICEKCNEPNEDNAIICKNCLNKSFIDYNTAKNTSLNIIEKNEHNKKILKILFFIAYFSIIIASLLVRNHISYINFNIIALSLLLTFFSVVCIFFTEPLCKLTLMFKLGIDIDCIDISDFYLYSTKIYGLIMYISLIYILLFVH